MPHPITSASPATEAAFQKLFEALDAEVIEFRRIGGDVAYRGTPLEARRVLSLASEHAKLRDHICELHAQWRKGHLQGILPPANQNPSPPATSGIKSKLIRNIKGMSVAEAARKLMVKPAQIKEWLEAGTLVGYRRVSGTWKITQADLVEFTRKHRDLL